jgi:hypothetical protein
MVQRVQLAAVAGEAKMLLLLAVLEVPVAAALII